MVLQEFIVHLLFRHCAWLSVNDTELLYLNLWQWKTAMTFRRVLMLGSKHSGWSTVFTGIIRRLHYLLCKRRMWLWYWTTSSWSLNMNLDPKKLIPLKCHIYDYPPAKSKAVGIVLKRKYCLCRFIFFWVWKATNISRTLMTFNTV